MVAVVLATGRKHRIERDDTWPAGQKRAVITIQDQYYEDVGGQLHPIVEDLETDGADGFAERADRANHKVRFGSNGTRRWYPRRNVDTEYVEFGRPEYWTGSAWAVLPLGTPTRTGNRYAWDRPNYALAVQFTWRRLKFEVTLKNSAAAGRMRWPVSITGLTRSGWDLYGADLVKIGTIDRPTALDANLTNVPVVASLSGGYVEIVPDLTGAVYPVVIDPTLDSQPDATAGKDNGISADNPTLNDGTGSSMATGVSGTTNTLRLLIEFDCSSIPAGSTCDSATLTLRNNYNDADTRAHTCYQLLSGRAGWVEAECTWNIWSTGNNWTTAGCSSTASDRSATALGTFTTASAPADVTCALNTTQVATWFGGSNANYGFIVQQDNETQDFTKNEFIASDNGTAGDRPQLVVVYTEAGAEGAGATAQAPGTPTAAGLETFLGAGVATQAIGVLTAVGLVPFTGQGITAQVAGTVAGVGMMGAGQTVDPFTSARLGVLVLGRARLGSVVIAAAGDITAVGATVQATGTPASVAVLAFTGVGATTQAPGTPAGVGAVPGGVDGAGATTQAAGVPAGVGLETFAGVGATTQARGTPAAAGLETFAATGATTQAKGTPAAVGIAAGPYATAVLVDAPIAYWRLGEPSGTVAADATGHGYGGTYTGGFTLAQTGALSGDADTATVFNGSTGYVSVGYNAALNPATFTIEAWAYPTGGAGTFRGVAASRAYPDGWVLYAGDDDTWQLWINNGAGMDVLAGGAVTLNAWAHLVATYDGTTARLYVNGTQVASGAVGSFTTNPSAALALGQGEPGTGFWFTGRLDEVAVYTGALSATRVGVHHATGSGGGVVGAGATTQAKGTPAAAGLETFAGAGATTQARGTPTGASAEVFAAAGATTQAKGTPAAVGAMGYGGAGATTQAKGTPAGAALLVFAAVGATTQAKGTPAGVGTVPDSAQGAGATTQARGTPAGVGLLAFVGAAVVTQARGTPAGVAWTLSGAGATTQAVGTTTAAALLRFLAVGATVQTQTTGGAGAVAYVAVGAMVQTRGTPTAVAFTGFDISTPLESILGPTRLLTVTGVASSESVTGGSRRLSVVGGER